MPTYPILLAHGIARFDFLRRHFVRHLGLDDDSLSDHLHYFRHIQSHLEPHGFDVRHTTVGFASSVEARAADLKAEVERVLAATSHTKVHIIGHSMGGLDARHMIVDLGMEASVCSLTTIGTPHSGSSFADWGREHRGEEALRGLENVIDLTGLLNLTFADCAAFNARAEPAEADNEVFYQTYACWEEERKRVFAPLQLSWEVIKSREEGENDGLVSVTSQRWTERLRGSREKEVGQHDFPVFGDHLNEVGWWEAEQLSGKLRLDALFQNPLTTVKNILNDRRQYEEQIQGTYLSIAEGLESRFPV
jgi:triacylglycerol lipase